MVRAVVATTPGAAQGVVPIWLAVRYRPLQAVLLLILSALITGCTVLAPLYYRGMEQALTRLTLDAAPSGATAIRLTSLSRYGTGLASVPNYTPASLDQLAGTLPETVRGWFLPPIDASSLLITRADQTSASPVGELLWRDGACAHVVWTAGGCPAAAGDVAVSAADVKNFGLAVGSTIDVVEQLPIEPSQRLPTVPLRVTGVYRQVPGGYWGDRLLAGISGFADAQPPYRPLHDSWLTPPATFTGPGAPRWVDPSNEVTFNLDRSAAGVERAQQLGPLVTTLTDRVALHVFENGSPLNGDHVLADVRSGLPGISATIDRGRRQALVTVPLLMIQLGLLTLFVLGLVLGAAVEQRRPEVALARLRGSGRTGARRMVLAELVPVVLAGVPAGVVVALGLGALTRHTVLDDAAPFELGSAFWTAIAAATLLLAAVTWLAAASGTRDRISALLRSVPIRVHGWAFGVADAVVVAGSATAVLAFVTGGLRGPLALAAPALLALLVGLLLAHLIVPTANWLGRRALLRGRYAASLAASATARRPATRRVVTVITVASALMVFSTFAISVGSRNRQLAAERDLGAPMVADLTGNDIGPVMRALTTVADGHETPVVRMSPSGQSFRTTLAVVPSAFERVVLLPDSDPGRVPWSRLQQETGRRLVITGRAISLLVTPEGFQPSPADAYLQLNLISSAGDTTSVNLGTIPTAGARTLGAAVPCTGGCTVAALTVVAYPSARYHGRMVISRVTVTGGSTNLPGTVADWRPGIAEPDRVEAVGDSPGALAVSLVNDGLTGLGMTSRWLPTTLPAVLAGSSTDPTGRTVNGNLLNGHDLVLVGVALLPRAPGLPGPAALVDLDLLQRWGTRVAKSAQIQVWFDSEDPARLATVRAALERGGVELKDVRRLSDVRRSFDASVPAWSLQLGVPVAIAGLVIATLVLVFLVASTFRRRARDLACLRMSGVPARGLRRAVVGEQLPITLLAVLAGAACGLLGAVVALPTMPLFAAPRSRSSLDLSTPWPSVLAVLAAELIVLAVVAWLCGDAVLARARLTRVRESL